MFDAFVQVISTMPPPVMHSGRMVLFGVTGPYSGRGRNEAQVATAALFILPWPIDSTVLFRDGGNDGHLIVRL